MKLAIALLCIVIFSSSCVRYSQGFDAYFCTSTESDKKSYLYIDNKKVGILPYVSYTPSASDESKYSRLLYKSLSSRSHKIKVLDEQGDVLFSGKIKAGRHGKSSSVNTSTKGKRWSTKVKINGNVLIADLLY